jgi:hypothetical protein
MRIAVALIAAIVAMASAVLAEQVLHLTKEVTELMERSANSYHYGGEHSVMTSLHAIH